MAISSMIGSLMGTGYGPTGPQRSQQSMQARGLASQRMAAAQSYYNNQMRAQQAMATGGNATSVYSFTTNVFTATTGASTTGTIYWATDDNTPTTWRDPTKIAVRDGERREITLPDGTTIDVASDGSFKISDDAAKVIYRANRVREFNAFLNASDKLEEFIRFCGQHGARQSEALGIPIQLFVQWLIVEAAKADKEEPPEDVPLLTSVHNAVQQPRCVVCQRFIPRAARVRRVEVCSSRCFERLAA